MKNTSNIKNVLLKVSYVTLIIIISACSNKQKPEDTKDVAEEHNEAKFDNKQEKDAQFLVNAAEINLEEIKLGQLAQQRGVASHVKDLGKMMEVAHTKSQADLTVLAKSKMISIPTSPTDDAKDTYKKLNDKSGNDFDKAYADLMVKRHKDAIDIFEKASIGSENSDIKNWATAKLPGLRTHLDHSIECQKKCDKI